MTQFLKIPFWGGISLKPKKIFMFLECFIVIYLKARGKTGKQHKTSFLFYKYMVKAKTRPRQQLNTCAAKLVNVVNIFSKISHPMPFLS